jgi:hypothetical protein
MKLKYLIFSLILSSNVIFSQNLILSVGTGLSFPMSEGNFTDAFNMGFNVHGSVAYPLSNNISLRGDLQYNRFPYDESSPNFSGRFTVTTIKADFLIGAFNLKTVSPYGVAGAGLYLTSSTISQNNVEISSSNTEFGLGLGGGVNFIVSSNASVYIEAQYNFIFTDNSAKGYLPLKGGVSFRL